MGAQKRTDRFILRIADWLARHVDAPRVPSSHALRQRWAQATHQKSVLVTLVDEGETAGRRLGARGSAVTPAAGFILASAALVSAADIASYGIAIAAGTIALFALLSTVAAQMVYVGRSSLMDEPDSGDLDRIPAQLARKLVYGDLAVVLLGVATGVLLIAVGLHLA